MRPTGGKEGMEEVGTREEPRVLRKVGLQWGDASWLLLLWLGFLAPCHQSQNDGATCCGERTA